MHVLQQRLHVSEAKPRLGGARVGGVGITLAGGMMSCVPVILAHKRSDPLPRACGLAVSIMRAYGAGKGAPPPLSPEELAELGPWVEVASASGRAALALLGVSETKLPIPSPSSPKRGRSFLTTFADQHSASGQEGEAEGQGEDEEEEPPLAERPRLPVRPLKAWATALVAEAQGVDPLPNPLW